MAARKEMCYDFNMQNPLAPTMQHHSWFYRRLTAHAAVVLHFHVHHTTLWRWWMMPHTNQKSERCDRRNNEAITLPLTCNTFTNLTHLRNATASLMDLASTSNIQYRSINQSTDLQWWKDLAQEGNAFIMFVRSHRDTQCVYVSNTERKHNFCLQGKSGHL